MAEQQRVPGQQVTRPGDNLAPVDHSLQAAPLSLFDDMAMLVTDPRPMLLPADLGMGSGVKREPGDLRVGPVADSLLEASWDAFYLGCLCGVPVLNNCAHYLSNAMLIAEQNTGMTWPTPFPAGSYKCPQGRMLRAKEMRDWFSSFATSFAANHSTLTADIWFVYQQRNADGQGHVCLHTETATSYTWRGTADFTGQWDVHWHYRW